MNEQYQLPNWFDNSILISLDNYVQSILGGSKGYILGDIKATIINPRHYDSSKLNIIDESQINNLIVREKISLWNNRLQP